jgi:hypothetical protein
MGFFDMFKAKQPQEPQEPVITSAQTGYIVSLMRQLDINPVNLVFNNEEVTITREGVNLVVTRSDGTPYDLGRGEASAVITGLLEERDK